MTKNSSSYWKPWLPLLKASGKVRKVTKHDPTAIVNFILTLFIAFVLLQSFYHRNLKPQVRALFGTLIAIADELYVSLCMGRARTALLECHAQPPP